LRPVHATRWRCAPVRRPRTRRPHLDTHGEEDGDPLHTAEVGGPLLQAGARPRRRAGVRLRRAAVLAALAAAPTPPLALRGIGSGGGAGVRGGPRRRLVVCAQAKAMSSDVSDRHDIGPQDAATRRRAGGWAAGGRCGAHGTPERGCGPGAPCVKGLDEQSPIVGKRPERGQLEKGDLSTVIVLAIAIVLSFDVFQ
jgi:hypothetical protein